MVDEPVLYPKGLNVVNLNLDAKYDGCVPGEGHKHFHRVLVAENRSPLLFASYSTERLLRTKKQTVKKS
jgi:hypothetical protein